MQCILWHQFRGIELDLIDFLFEKSYLSLLLLVIIVEICAKAPHRINRYCLKRFSDVAFSKNNGLDGSNLKTMEMTEGDHLEFRHSHLSKYKMISEMGSALCETFDRKSGITPVSMTIFFWSTFSVWPPAAILNSDVWARQNTRNDTRIAENEFLMWNSASYMGYMAQNRKKWNW